MAKTSLPKTSAATAQDKVTDRAVREGGQLPASGPSSPRPLQSMLVARGSADPVMDAALVRMEAALPELEKQLASPVVGSKLAKLAGQFPQDLAKAVRSQAPALFDALLGSDPLLTMSSIGYYGDGRRSDVLLDRYRAALDKLIALSSPVRDPAKIELDKQSQRFNLFNMAMLQGQGTSVQNYAQAVATTSALLEKPGIQATLAAARGSTQDELVATLKKDQPEFHAALGQVIEGLISADGRDVARQQAGSDAVLSALYSTAEQQISSVVKQAAPQVPEASESSRQISLRNQLIDAIKSTGSPKLGIRPVIE
ncbi:MAG: hypothetical protein HY791_32490 [Deltaproteobacteria bacterium]|nr:hypothetical protein [Deltaproteobacteria bacterium]